MEAYDTPFIANLETEYEQCDCKSLNLSLWIETYFKRFGYNLSFDRDGIVTNPTECINSGLQTLRDVGVINNGEYLEHIRQYNWGMDGLETVLKDANNVVQLLSLIRCLNDWHCRWQEKNSNNEDEI